GLGYAPVMEVATLGGQTYHRVVLPGLADRAAAERLGERLRAELGITYLIRRD
ncbi:SPOR domain-containing protein, partial [bacterium]|nr:SPOR domain-containing protein [bacterium]